MTFRHPRLNADDLRAKKPDRIVGDLWSSGPNIQERVTTNQ
jgi:hypothetical protein